MREWERFMEFLYSNQGLEDEYTWIFEKNIGHTHLAQYIGIEKSK
jgi:hypothetical protein